MEQWLKIERQSRRAILALNMASIRDFEVSYGDTIPPDVLVRLLTYSRKHKLPLASRMFCRILKARGLSPLADLTHQSSATYVERCARRDENGDTPLTYAISAGDVALATQLLDAGADPNEPDVMDCPPLIVATLEFPATRLDMLSLLLSRGAAIDATFSYGRTALMWASSGGDEETALFLVAHGADTSLTDDFLRPALTWAALAGATRVVSTLLAASAAVNIVSEYGTTPLMAACVGEADLPLVEMLLDARADVHVVSAWGESALHNAIVRGQCGIVEALLRAKADPNKRTSSDTSALALAAVHGHADVVEALARGGADVDARDARGRTPLMAAAMARAGTDALDILLRSGATLDVVDACGRTALGLAVACRRPAAVQRLLELGASPVYARATHTPAEGANSTDSGPACTCRDVVADGDAADASPHVLAQWCVADDAWRAGAVAELAAVCAAPASVLWEDGEGCTALMRFCREPLVREDERARGGGGVGGLDACSGGSTGGVRGMRGGGGNALEDVVWEWAGGRQTRGDSRGDGGPGTGAGVGESVLHGYYSSYEDDEDDEEDDEDADSESEDESEEGDEDEDDEDEDEETRWPTLRVSPWCRRLRGVPAEAEGALLRVLLMAVQRHCAAVEGGCNAAKRDYDAVLQ